MIGRNLDEFGERFPAINGIYNKESIERIYNISKEKGISIHKGVFMFYTGPSYETTAEVEFIRKINADARAMSTVPEIIVAAHSKMKVLAFSCITNVSRSDEIDTHEEVVRNATKAAKNMKEVLKIATEVI